MKRLFLLFISLIVFPSSLIPSAIRMVIIEKEQADHTYTRRILLGNLPYAKVHDSSKQQEVLMTCFERLNEERYAPALFEGYSTKSIQTMKLIESFLNPNQKDSELSHTVAYMLSKKAESFSYLISADPRERLLAMKNFMNAAGKVITNLIIQGKDYNSLLAKMHNTYTIGDVLQEYERTITEGIKTCKSVEQDAKSVALKNFAAKALREFEQEKEHLLQEHTMVPLGLRLLSYGEFIGNYTQKENSHQDASVGEKAALQYISNIIAYASTPLFTNKLLELSLFSAVISSEAPQTMATLSAEVHNQKLIDLLVDEGFTIIYDSAIKLKVGAKVNRLFDGDDFSPEWRSKAPFSLTKSDLELYVEPLDSNKLENMYYPRRLFPNAMEQQKKHEDIC